MSDHHTKAPARACSCCGMAMWERMAHHIALEPSFIPGLQAALAAALQRHTSAAREPQARIFTGGPIHTMAQGHPHTVEALGIQAGKITVTGTLATVQAHMPQDTATVALHGRTLLPGLIEPHLHLLPTAVLRGWLDLTPFDGQRLRPAYDLDWIQETLRAAVHKAQDDASWILGRGVDPSLMRTWKNPDKDWLDAITHAHPIFLLNASGHLAYANTLALQHAGLPAGEGHNGILLEVEQMEPILRAIPRPSPEALATNLAHVLHTAASRGVTMLYDAGLGSGFGPRELDILSCAAHTGGCPVRIAGALSANNQALLDTWLQAYHPGYGDALFSVQAMKLVADGSNQGLTGFQTVPYAYHDPQLPLKGNKGLFNFASLDYPALVKRIVDAGWPVLIHANGDAAIHLTLEAYRSALHGTSGLAKRHRIEHCSVLDTAHIQTLQELGISPSFLIGHIGYWGAAFNQTILGEDRARLVDRCASAAKAGLRFSLHTDHFITPLGPLRLMEQAISRRMEGAPGQESLNPDECLTPAQALKAVTYDAAWQCHMDAVGSLEPGKWADFAILDADLLNPPAHLALRDIPVYQTWLGGQVTYAAYHGRESWPGHPQQREQ